MTVNGGRHEPGEETRDLRKAAVGNPDDHKYEASTQRRGNRCLAGGFATIGLTLITALSLSVIYNDSPFPNPDAKVFATLALTVLMVLGTLLLSIGLNERVHRGHRARQIAGNAIAYESGVQALQMLQQHILNTEEQLKVIMAYVEAVPGRLNLVDERIDSVANAFFDQSQRRYWTGYSDAVKEGLGEETGTDGNGRRRPPYIGLVPPDDPDGE